VRGAAIPIGSAAVALLTLVFACGLSVDDGSQDPVTSSPDTSTTDAPPPDSSPLPNDGGDGESGERDADAGEPLTGFCATHPTAFLCDDFDRGTLSKWDGIQTTNGNSLMLSNAQSKTPPSSVLVNMFDSPDSGPTATSCDKAALYKVFTLDFQEAELSFDIYPTAATGRNVAATLFMADIASGSYQIEVAVGTNAFIQEVDTGLGTTQTSFAGDLVPNSWTRVTIRYSRSPRKVSVLYDKSLKHEKTLQSGAYTMNHRLYVGDFCAKRAGSFHVDNVVFEKLR
jgi:hypothetical protein